MRQRQSLFLLATTSLCIASGLPAQETESPQALSPFLVEGDRLIQPDVFDDSNSGASFSNSMVGGVRIGIDDLSETIAQYPAYAAFRKTPSRAAHPTTQGVRLRNLGINSTSRTLVTFDGVPQNDPFGGWIYWHRYMPSSLSSIEIRPSSGSEAWGNYGTGGRIALLSSIPRDPRIHTKATIGSDGAKRVSFTADAALSQSASFNLSALKGDTDGFYTLRADQRGSIDKKANSDVFALQGTLNLEPNEDWRITLKADTYEEDRSNGTPLAINGTDASDISFSALRIFDEGTSGFRLVAYSQDRDFHNQFTAVADDRASERPALDQYNVPASAEGASISYFTQFGESNTFSIGADHRKVDGEVNERYRNLGAGFTRLRRAGGEQRFNGLFATAQFEASPATRIVANARIDEVDDRMGLRREWNTETDTLIRDDSFPDTSRSFFSNNITLYHDVSDTVRLMARQTSGFRAPTLNERYRPFRVKNDIIESNALLKAEEHFGFEAGIRFLSDELWSVSANLFQYELDNMIANVVLSRESGFNPLCGFVPGGGSCGQRLNILESSVQGIEVNWESPLSDSVHAQLQFVYAASDIDFAGTLNGIEGNEFPHSSPFKATLSLDWNPKDTLSMWTNIRYQDSEYEDLENNRPLGSAIQIAGGIRYAVSSEHAISLRVENLLDEEIETGISSAGLVSISAPRTFWLSWDFSR